MYVFTRFFLGLFLLSSLALAPLLPAATACAQGPAGYSYIYGEAGAEFSSGDYGTSDNTEVFSIPVTLGYSPNPNLEFYATIVPFMYQNTTNLVSVSGLPVRGKMHQGAQAALEKESETGIGDTTVGLTFFALNEAPGMPEIDLLASVKIPTADEDKGLGTGEFDYSVGLTLSKGLRDWSCYGTLEYNFLGDPGGDYDIDNYASVTLGLTRRCLPNLNNTLYLFAGQAISDYSDEQLEIGIKSRLSVDKNNELSVYLSKGLADGSPEYGMGAFWSHYL